MRFLLSIEPPVTALEKVKKIAEKEGLFQQTEFHITIIGRESGDVIETLLQKLPIATRDKITEEINGFLQKYAWSYTPADTYFLIAKQYEEDEKRRSLIQTIEMPELVSFYNELNMLLTTSFLTPFPHITLYTQSTRADKKLLGIGIYSHEQFLALCPKKIIYSECEV